MRDVASAWLVTDLSSSPFAVSAVQAAATLPAFLLAIPAGVLSDIVDRRHLLIGILLGLASVSVLLSALSATGVVTVEVLVGLTFLGGIGAALSAPSWQAIVPELVPRSDLKSAVALNSLGFNIARAIGPAIGRVAGRGDRSGRDLSFRRHKRSHRHCRAALVETGCGRRRQFARTFQRGVAGRTEICPRQCTSPRRIEARISVLPAGERDLGIIADRRAARARRRSRAVRSPAWVCRGSAPPAAPLSCRWCVPGWGRTAWCWAQWF